MITWMETVNPNAGAVKSASQLFGVEDVGKLGVVVGVDAVVGILRVEVVPLYFAMDVHVTTEDHNSGN